MVHHHIHKLCSDQRHFHSAQNQHAPKTIHVWQRTINAKSEYILFTCQQRDTILTCLASSRVGTSTTTLGALPYCLFVDLKLSFKLNDSRIGSTNANVLPCKIPQCQVQQIVFSKRAKLHNETFTFRNGLCYQCLYICQSTEYQLHKIPSRIRRQLTENLFEVVLPAYGI